MVEVKSMENLEAEFTMYLWTPIFDSSTVSLPLPFPWLRFNNT